MYWCGYDHKFNTLEIMRYMRETPVITMARVIPQDGGILLSQGLQ